jgi:hypothetical protein
LFHERLSSLADFLKRHFEVTKLLRAQYREHSLHLARMLSEGWNNEVLAARGEADVRTRRSLVLSTRVTKSLEKRRSTATLIEPGVRSTIGPIVLTGIGPLCTRTSSTRKSESPSPVSSIPAVA